MQTQLKPQLDFYVELKVILKFIWKIKCSRILQKKSKKRIMSRNFPFTISKDTIENIN